ncbi:MAG: hypothetical protein GY940_28420 [bacterium]|nr:hypothetical protein [bacterium]
MNISFGTIKKDGTVENKGSGDWTSLKIGTGEYDINFTSAKAVTPVVSASAFGGSGSAASDNVFSTYNILTTGFHVVSLDVAGNKDPGYTPQDASFSFIAVTND